MSIRFSRSLRGFRRDDSGAATVEAVLWFPFYVMLFLLIIDVSLMFHGQAKAQRVARDVTRLASMNFFADASSALDESEMKSRAETLVHAFSPRATVTTHVDGDSVQVFISMPNTDLTVARFYDFFVGGDIKVSAAHLLEV